MHFNVEDRDARSGICSLCVPNKQMIGLKSIAYIKD